MTTPRVAGKLGARPAVFPAGLRTLDAYAPGGLPAPPVSVEVPDFPSWDVLGNDEFGNCGVAGIEHLFEMDSVSAGGSESFPTAEQCVSYYLHYTGGQDTGVVLSQFLAYVRQHGYYGHKVSAFAPVQVHDVNTLKTAVFLYDSAYTGITVSQGMMDAFQAGKPWDSKAVAGPPVGGHCVPVAGYSDEGLTVITWGSPQLITWPAWHSISTEAWAVICGELADGDGHGINLAALQADLSKLDTPAPAPQPAAPGILAELASLIRAVEADGMRDVSEVLVWLTSHGL